MQAFKRTKGKLASYIHVAVGKALHARAEVFSSVHAAAAIGRIRLLPTCEQRQTPDHFPAAISPAFARVRASHPPWRGISPMVLRDRSGYAR
jgi:hypothetical protein